MSYKKLQVTKLSSDFREAVEVVEVPLKPPSSDEVLVKVHYAGTNASDINMSAGRYFTDGKVPFDIGFEALGVIEQIGQNVKGLEVGQYVVYWFGGQSGYAEYVYASPENLYLIPSLDPRYISALVCGLTATIGIDEAGKIKEGETVLITAAAGGTGQYCVQWAKTRGCYVIGTASNQSKIDFLKSIGCDKVYNYQEESLDEALTRDFPNGINVIWETIGGATCEMLIKHLAKFGRLVVIGGIEGYKDEGFPRIEISPGYVCLKSLTFVGFLLSEWRHKFPEYLPKLISGIKEGKLNVKVDLGEGTESGKFIGVEDCIRAVEHLHSGKNIGKVVTQMQ